ncbi:MAG: hypothetical protein KY394_07590 [Actinobacteria bacterium]|nr:hypothetical protein [Actinomycetota bacterium]
MAEIDVEALDERTYRVTVGQGGSTSTHEVTVGPAELALKGEGTSVEQLVEASFRFLLDREPKESILPSFDLSVIARYFPEYPDRIGDYM